MLRVVVWLLLFKLRWTRPPAAVSAMDGYAVRLGDVSVPGVQLRLVGSAPAGSPFDGIVGRGEAVRIFTGGEVPSGADHIVIQEEASADGTVVTCRNSYQSSRYIRHAGLDFSEGETLIEPGTVLGVPELAVIAAANFNSVPVFRKPRIGILANGDELVPPGSLLKGGQLIEKQ